MPCARPLPRPASALPPRRGQVINGLVSPTVMVEGWADGEKISDIFSFVGDGFQELGGPSFAYSP